MHPIMGDLFINVDFSLPRHSGEQASNGNGMQQQLSEKRIKFLKRRAIRRQRRKLPKKQPGISLDHNKQNGQANSEKGGHNWKAKPDKNAFNQQEASGAPSQAVSMGAQNVPGTQNVCIYCACALNLSHPASASQGQNSETHGTKNTAKPLIQQPAANQPRPALASKGQNCATNGTKNTVEPLNQQPAAKRRRRRRAPASKGQSSATHDTKNTAESLIQEPAANQPQPALASKGQSSATNATKNTVEPLNQQPAPKKRRRRSSASKGQNSATHGTQNTVEPFNQQPAPKKRRRRAPASKGQNSAKQETKNTAKPLTQQPAPKRPCPAPASKGQNSAKDGNQNTAKPLIQQPSPLGECKSSLLPANSAASHKMVAIDCEMVGTGPRGHISSLARCSIVNYQGDVMYDKYVKPTLPVVDYRTRWSGIQRHHLVNAVPFSLAQKEVLQLLRGKIVIGHAIHNDYKALGYFHPTELTRDTSKIPLLNRIAGFPERETMSLKRLAKQVLQQDIQMGKMGHSSVEDARATMKLYRAVEAENEMELAAGKVKQ